MSMIRLLYISTSRQPVTPAALADILRASRRNNFTCHVTGLLVVGGKRFLQALEGPEEAVQATFDRIYKDPRHYALVELAREAITERQFPNWAMGSQAGATPQGHSDVSDAVTALISPIKDASLRGYFTGFAERRAAA